MNDYFKSIYMKNHLLLFLLIIGMSACTSKPQETSEAAQEEVHNHDADHHHDHGDPRVAEVMAIHDSIMPRMQDLLNLKKELVAQIGKADSTLNKGNNALAKAEKKEGEAIKQRLEQADEAMMEWMHQYNADTLDQLDTEKAALYVADQKRKIVNVRDLMNSTQREAEKFLRKDKQ